MLTWLRHLDRVIRGEATRPSVLRQGEIEQPVGGLVILGAILGALYGLCMGSYAVFQKSSYPGLQIIAAMVKVPVLFFLTLAVTFPSLYVFNALVGSRLSLVSVLRLLVIALAVMLTVLASLGPIVAFFSASTSSYAFMILLNVLIFAVAGFLGIRFMLVTLNRLSYALSSAEPQPPVVEKVLPTAPAAAPPAGAAPAAGPPLPPMPQKAPGALQPAAQGLHRDVKTVFRIWMVVFGLVGAQMAWVLRPFLGAPGHVFTWFRPRSSNFYEGVIYALQHLFK